MNKSESKYFNTAIRMDKAFLELLEQKDFAFITVKEICKKAEVNRSTFYLHYETIGDLLSESMDLIIKEFVNHMNEEPGDFIQKIKNCPLEELYLIIPSYLTPYLNYIKDHQRLFRTVIENASTLRMDTAYTKMYYHIFSPFSNASAFPNRTKNILCPFTFTA